MENTSIGLALLLAQLYINGRENECEVGFRLPLSMKKALEIVNEEVEINVEECLIVHQRRVEEELRQKEEASSPRCHCGSVMVKRINSNTRQSFWGCSRFPTCKVNEKRVSLETYDYSDNDEDCFSIF